MIKIFGELLTKVFPCPRSRDKKLECSSFSDKPWGLGLLYGLGIKQACPMLHYEAKNKMSCLFKMLVF